jgi:branched-chain amino acid aminotransferase
MQAAKGFINVNGQLVGSDAAVFTINNRAFRYGDGLFESMRMINGSVPFLSLHLERLKQSCKFLKFNTDDVIEERKLKKQLSELALKNNIEGNAKIRFTCFREDGGLYTPNSNKINYSIEIAELNNSKFELNVKGLSVELFQEIKKQVHPLSNFKSNNCLIYVLAGIYKTEKKFDDCILLNERSNICEAISSNLFLVINGALYTPSLSEGCLDGVMRRVILENAPKHRINIYESAIMPNDLLRADELFLSNAVNGINWIGSYKNKRYYNNTTKKILSILNDLVQ